METSIRSVMEENIGSPYVRDDVRMTKMRELVEEREREVVEGQWEISRRKAIAGSQAAAIGEAE